MTPPIRPSWSDPDAHNLHDAVQLARQRAGSTHQAHTICAVIPNGELAFEVVLSGSYAKIKEAGRDGRLAPIASVLPNGTVELYPALRGMTLLAAVSTYGTAAVREIAG